MVARRLRLTVVASLCGLVGVLVVGAGSAVAASQFGSSGSEAGQLRDPAGVALDTTGDVYIGDQKNRRVDKFGTSENFLFAWGAGVVDGADELQTCTGATLCSEGLSGAVVAGAFEFPTGIAVDDEPLSASYGDVYVVDHYGERVEKFSSTGEFILMFGGHVNETTGGDVCVAGEACRKEATEGTANGEFSYWLSSDSFIGVGPGGAVYVGDQARVEVFEPSGAWKENISLAPLSSTASPTALAVDSTGDVYVKDEGVEGVHEFEPGGTEKAFQLDAGSTTVTALAVGSSGDVYVGDSSGGFHVLKYDSAGNELASFGSSTVVGENKGLAFSPVTNDLYATSLEHVWVISSPPAGPVVETESATPGLRGSTTLEALVNPEGNETTYLFEYIDEASYQSSGFASATSTASVAITSGLFEDHAVSVDLTGLVPGATYHYRVVAKDSLGHTTTGSNESVTTIPPAYIEGPWSVNPSSTSVTLDAQINPLGASTSYRWEYGTTTAYGHVFAGSAGEGMGFVPTSYHAQELEADTVYHYRIVTISEVGTVVGEDHTFTTQLVGGELALPDGRVWELVSPPNKKGALIEPNNVQIAGSEGNAIAYQTSGPNVGENPVASDNEESYVLSKRTLGGWTSQDITPPRQQTVDGWRLFDLFGEKIKYRVFSQDLSSAVFEPLAYSTPPLSPEATERTLYLRDNATGTFLPLVTPANVPPGTKFGGFEAGRGGPEPEDKSGMRFDVATPDLSHVVFETSLALKPEASMVPIYNCGFSLPYTCSLPNLYEWSGGQFQLVNILPNGEATHTGEEEPNIARESEHGSNIHAISNDGRWIAWTLGVPYNRLEYSGLYVRDMIDKKTVKVGGKDPFFEMMSGDGSKVFFREDDELYVFDTATDTQTDLTANHGAGEYNAGVGEAVIGASEDGAYLYFVAKGVLANGGVSGEDNLYLSHDEVDGWKTELVARLTGDDEKGWLPTEGRPPVARVSPDGRNLTFMSDRPLTGYDNTDAVSGQPDEEVFLFDADTGRTVCVSCSPTGARPVGIYEETEERELLVDPVRGWNHHGLAANIPISRDSNQQPRSLLDDGRVFFDSADALVPQDTNGLEDVYEYEPPGVGDCSSASRTFSERSGGCVSLVSSGQSAAESAFFGASETGDDAFFFTSSRLVAEDYDTSDDIYDAHVCSEANPCHVAPVLPPACTSGDSCKAAPSPQPAIFGSAPSATFSGAGNVTVSSAKTVVTGRSLTRAQKLARALRVCRKKNRDKRTACERQANKRYPAKHAGKTKATRKGKR